MSGAGAKVNLFVVGAMKAGTTSFVDLLDSHPEIYLPPVKEPHFFADELPSFVYEPSRFYSEENYFAEQFPEPMHICCVERERNYEKLFSLAGSEKYLLDASTAYLAIPGTARLISAYNDAAKIIIITRDPLQRMFSHYKMRCGLSAEMRDFETVVQEEIELYNNDNLPWASYLGMSLYQIGIKEFRAHFNSVLLIRFEDMVRDTESVLRDISEFLGIDEFESNSMAKTNVTRKLKFRRLFYVLKRLGLKDYFSKTFGSSFKQRVFRAVSSEADQELTLSDDSREQLNAIFGKGSYQ